MAAKAIAGIAALLALVGLLPGLMPSMVTQPTTLALVWQRRANKRRHYRGCKIVSGGPLTSIALQNA